MFRILYLNHVVVACAVFAGAFLGLASAPAEALETITCTGSTYSTFNPPITNQPTASTYLSEHTYGPCISTVPGISSGGFSGSAQVERSCLSLLEIVPSLSITIDWNNGQSSTAEVGYVANIVGALYTVTLTGAVTDGVFQGRSFVQQMTAPATDIALCTLGLSGVSEIQYINVLEIL